MHILKLNLNSNHFNFRMKMSQIDAFKNTFKCDLCSEIYITPIILPCGETICEKDLEIFFNNSVKFQCTFCQEEHERPQKGFLLNKIVQQLLDLQVSRIDFRKNFSKYEKCQTMLKEIADKLDEIYLIETDQDYFIHSHFENIINQVDVQREKLIAEINLYSDETIEKIKKDRDECINRKILISNECEKMKRNMDEMQLKLNSFDISDKKIEQILQNIEQMKPEIIQKLIQTKSKLLLNKSHEFSPVEVSNLNMEKFCGILISQIIQVCLIYF